MLYATDHGWWFHHYQTIVASGFPGELWTQSAEAPAKYPAIKRIPGVAQPGLGRERIHTGSNSGYAALNLAYIRGATDIYLLGYDMQLGPNKKRHFFGSHPKGLERDSGYHGFMLQFKTIDPQRYGLTIVNCTRETALEHFPRRDLDEVVAELRAEKRPRRGLNETYQNALGVR